MNDSVASSGEKAYYRQCSFIFFNYLMFYWMSLFFFTAAVMSDQRSGRLLKCCGTIWLLANKWTWIFLWYNCLLLANRSLFLFSHSTWLKICTEVVFFLILFSPSRLICSFKEAQGRNQFLFVFVCICVYTPGHIILQAPRQFVSKATHFPVTPRRRFVFSGAPEECSAKMDVVFVILQVLWSSCKIN